MKLEDFEARGDARGARRCDRPSSTVWKSPSLKARGVIQLGSIGSSVGATVLHGLSPRSKSALGERAVAVPRARHARLAPGVRELQRRHRALALHELGDASQAGDVGVVPDAGVAVRDAPARSRPRWLRRTPTPAPPCANLPRCTRCQSVTWPSCAEYWHMGEMTMRLRSRHAAQLRSAETGAANSKEEHALAGGLRIEAAVGLVGLLEAPAVREDPLQRDALAAMNRRIPACPSR